MNMSLRPEDSGIMLHNIAWTDTVIFELLTEKKYTPLGANSVVITIIHFANLVLFGVAFKYYSSLYTSAHAHLN